MIRLENKIIDLRSDTVTRPPSCMLATVLEAELGDDIMGEDPTVEALEKRAAELLGKEDAIFLTSGTMANQVALMTFCARGEEVIMGEDSHIYNLEGAATSAVAQVQIRTVRVNNGRYDIEALRQAVHTGDIQKAKTGLISLENTYNLNAGQVMPLDNLQEIQTLAENVDVPIYMDGARIFNAAAALGVSAKEIAGYADAVQFCLTKGLAAPVGSILAGSKTFIQSARINKQRLGGGMRQAGVIAAPALYALNHMVDRLSEDNDRAQWLTEAISKLPHFCVNVDDFHTNIVSPIITHENIDAEDLIEFLNDEGIKVKHIGKKQIRMIIHYEIDDDALKNVASALERFSAQLQE